MITSKKATTLTKLAIGAGLIAAFLAPSQGFAAHLVSTGTFVANFNKAQVNDAGDKKKFELVPYLSYGQQFHITGPHYFMPELALAYYLNPAKKTKKQIVFLRYDFSYILSRSFILRYGLSTYWKIVSGEGGTVTLKNGSSYSDFPAPSGRNVSYYTTVDFGAEFFFNKSRGLRLDFNMMNAGDFDNRAFNYILTYNWYL